MTVLAFATTSDIAKGRLSRAPVTLPPSRGGGRRRLSAVMKQHAPRGGVVSVYRKTDDPFSPVLRDDTVKLRKDWHRTLVGPDDIVLVWTPPRGGAMGGGGGGGGGKSGGAIALTIAAVALMAIAPYAVPALGPALGLALGVSATTGAFLVQAGLTVAAMGLQYAAQRARRTRRRRRLRTSTASRAAATLRARTVASP